MLAPCDWIKYVWFSWFLLGKHSFDSFWTFKKKWLLQMNWYPQHKLQVNKLIPVINTGTNWAVKRIPKDVALSTLKPLSMCCNCTRAFQSECTVCDVRQRQSVRILQNFSETRRVSSPGHYCKRPAEGDRSAWIQASVESDHSGFDVSRLLFLFSV